jgi:acyl-CoA reductase-like NAD-dependent aldehyde dehydrogenase
MQSVGAIAAGNCVLMKPSELSVHCTQLMSELIPKYLDEVRRDFKCFPSKSRLN